VKREGKRENHYQSPECRGLKPLRSEYLGDVLSTHSSSFFTPKRTTPTGLLSTTPISLKKHQVDHSTLGFQTNFKFFNKFHTRASELLMIAKNRVPPPTITKSPVDSHTIS
jgi:hypothetical protein